MNVFWTVLVLAVSHVAQDELLSTYDNQLAHGNVSPQQCHFESVVVTDVDAHSPAKELSAATIRHVKEKGNGFIQICHGPKPVNKFFNVSLFPMLYPTLFPYGCGGFEDKDRIKAISLKDHVKYLFTLQDRRFQTHYSFLFTV